MSAVAQYDAYENPTASQREAFPYFVQLQNDQLAEFSTRLVMPLARLPAPPAELPRRLAQPVQVRGERLFPAAQLCAAVPARLLRRPVATLGSQASVFVDALDAVVSGV